MNQQHLITGFHLPIVNSLRWALLVSYIMFVAACTTVPQEPSEKQVSEPVTTPQTIDSERLTQIPDADAGRPKVPLSEEILYKLLLAEIAGQRGKLQISVDNYLDLAKQTLDPKLIERATRIAVFARNNKAATEAATLWTSVDPGNADAHQVLAVMAIRNGLIEKAIGHLEVILNSNAGKLDQKLWMIANLLGREKDQKMVLTVMERLMRNHENDADALFAYAHVVARLGDMEKAQTLMDRVLEINPDNENAIINYVSILQRQNKFTEALVWLKDRLDAKKQDNFNLHLIYARLLADARRYEEARREFEILAAKAPNNTDVLYALGLLYMESNRLEESERYFLRLSKQKGRTDDANYYLGRIAEENKQFEKAGSWYQGVLKGNHYFDSQIRMGMLLSKQGKIQEAREQLRNIKTKNVQEESIITQAEGEILVDAKRYDDALELFNKVLESRYDADILYSRAMLAEKMDRLDLLEADLKKIIEQDPKNGQALNALGYTLADRTDRYDEAYEYIKQALEVSPNDFYIIDSMGWILYRLGRLDEAVTYLRKAMSLRADPEIAAHLGEVLWVMGDKESAKTIWDAALQETPGDANLLDVIKRFSY